MKITITWKTSAQISLEDFTSYTKVIHCDESETLKQIHEKITGLWKENKDFDGEIHIEA